jgi:hypothetical protein
MFKRRTPQTTHIPHRKNKTKKKRCDLKLRSNKKEQEPEQTAKVKKTNVDLRDSYNRLALYATVGLSTPRSGNFERLVMFLQYKGI